MNFWMVPEFFPQRIIGSKATRLHNHEGLSVQIRPVELSLACERVVNGYRNSQRFLP